MGEGRGLDQRQSEEYRFGDRYQVLEPLGKGGMGTVLKARHTLLDKLVAIKILNPALLSSDVSRQRFEIEAQAGSKLAHPNLVSVFDYGFTSNGEPFLVMEYIEGVSLAHHLEKQGRLSLKELLHIFIPICKVLQYVHSTAIVHRDIKTSNIMLQTIGTETYVKLLDFGIAKVFNESGETARHLTVTGIPYGSPLYMSPEQCQGEKVDQRSDIYSLGCVLYECFSGRAPIVGENPLQTLFKQVNELPKPLAASTQAEAAFSVLVQNCLNKKPDERVQSAAELLRGLNTILAMGHTVETVPVLLNKPPIASHPSPLRQSRALPSIESRADEADQSHRMFASLTRFTSFVNRDLFPTLKALALLLFAIVVIFNLGTGLITAITYMPQVWRLKGDTDKLYQASHENMMRYTEQLSRLNKPAQ
jgi:serine/threonine-protein kinase